MQEGLIAVVLEAVSFKLVACWGLRDHMERWGFPDQILWLDGQFWLIDDFIFI